MQQTPPSFWFLHELRETSIFKNTIFVVVVAGVVVDSCRNLGQVRSNEDIEKY